LPDLLLLPLIWLDQVDVRGRNVKGTAF